MAKYQGLSLNISPILLRLSQTGSCSVRLFGQGQALASEVCVPHLPAALGLDITRATEFPPSRCAVALSKHLCNAWEIRSNLQMDAEHLMVSEVSKAPG